MNIVTVGVDISKKKFDASFKQASKWKHAHFSNDPKGFSEFVEWLTKFDLPSVHIVTESTGRYGVDFSYFCHRNKLDISVVNPARIKFYGMSKLSRVKTDKADARLIAEFGMQNKLPLWCPKNTSAYKLQNLDRCVKNLKDSRTRFLNNIEGSSDEDIINHYKDLISSISEKIAHLEKKMLDLISQEKELSEDYQNLLTIPGIAEKTAISMLAEIPDIKQFDTPKQLVAYAGLNPSIQQSGSSVRGKGSISKKGSGQLRKSLYYPSLAAKRFSKKLQPFIKNLENKGKKPKEIIVACMRKLLETIYWVLKKKEVYTC